MRLRISRLSILVVVVLFAGGVAAQAKSRDRRLGKVDHYEPYRDQQKDWPRSAEHVVPVAVSHDMPIYDKLPSRPYELIGTMTDESDKAVKHVAQAAAAVGADALLVVDDKAFRDAGLTIEPKLWEHHEIPDPKGPAQISRLEHPEALKSGSQPATISVTKVEAILIRWKAR